jgi:signal transduction histidine kinase/CheY-like chemotaxis protein
VSRLPAFSQRWGPVPLLAVLSALALLAAGALTATFNERAYRAQALSDIDAQAQILAASVSAALAFDDRAAAQEYIDALKANPALEAAAVYDTGGRLFAGFARGRASGLPNQPRFAPAHYEAGHGIAQKPVAEGEARLGTVYLRSVAEPTAVRLRRHGGAALLVVMAILLLGVLAAATSIMRRTNAQLAERARELTEANRLLQVQIEERERAEEALRQSQKMEAMGQLTGGVAHDFNNILMVASSGLDLMDRAKDDARRQMLKDGIRQAIDRGAALTRQLLAFSRRTALKPEVVDLAAQIGAMGDLLDRSLREDITVHLDLADDLWPVEVDPTQFELALLNVAVNARDAMPTGGAITIGARNAPGVNQGGLVGDFVRVWVQDEGRGIAPELLARVFEPFFTTKEVGKGTGLGLSQVYGFSRSSGGDVRVESQVGEGATFSLLIPRSSKPLTKPRPEPAHTTAPGRGRVLLVEDDEAVAHLAVQMLEELGYRAVRAADPPSAVALFEADPAFDMVFSDLVMPGEMDGTALARELRRRRPDLPILLTTGYSPAAAAAASEGFPILSKPYRIEALAQALGALSVTSRSASP